MIILALDALDLNQVKKHNCKNLMQKEYGQTSLSDFKQERTVVLWSSFLTGKNMETNIPLKTQWEFKIPINQTFFAFFNSAKAIDVPAVSHKPAHEEERKLLKGYFDDQNTIEDYDSLVWKIHEGNKKEFFSAIGNFNLTMGYFNLADSIGHLSFGITQKMAEVYQELDKIAKEIKNMDNHILIISDHGMKEVGRYGDHNRSGFYSFNNKMGLDLPKVTEFYEIIRRLSKNEYAKN
jgi:hypothetical protein